MTKQDRINRDKIVSMMCSTARYYGKETTFSSMLDFANRLHRLETTLSRLADDEATSPYFEKRNELKQERIEKLAEKLVTETLGCKCYTQRDPRGFAIRMYLVNEEGRKWSNTWDGVTTGLAW